jgi:IrrE N-terminal-like domain
MRLQHFIDRLERFAAARGVTVFRTALDPWVLGRLQEKRMILHSGMSKERQLLTLIHELAHLLAHSDERLNRTVCEYEAEAVERLVAGQLGLLDSTRMPIDISTVTDNLLACSVARVRSVSGTLLAAARDAPSGLQAQATIEI